MYMRKMSRLIRKEKTEQSVSEMVTENKSLRFKDILYIIEQLCLLPGLSGAEGENGQICRIHPDNVIIDIRGDVRLDDRNLPISVIESYIPSESDQTNPAEPGAAVYALGILMLYMATGQCKKTEADPAVIGRSLFLLIERCAAFDPEERFQNIKELREAIEHEMRAGKNAVRAALVTALSCLMIGFLVFFWQEGKTRGRTAGEAIGYKNGFSNGFRQGFSDAPGIGIRSASFDAGNGNLSGNFAAKGGAIAVSGEDAEFFIFEGDICSMNPYTKEIHTVAVDAEAYNLQYYDEALYYCTKEHIIRMDPESLKKEVICDSRGGQFYIFDDIFYLYDSSGTGYLYRIDRNNGTLTQLNGAMKYRHLNVAKKKLYYIAPDRGGCICCSELDGGRERLISSSAYKSFCIYDGGIYAATEGGLVHTDLNGGNPEYLTTLPASFPNVAAGGIYYISDNRRTLEWMSLDGGMRYTVVPTRTATFNIAGHWIFYNNEEDGGRLWKTRISGADSSRVMR